MMSRIDHCLDKDIAQLAMSLVAYSLNLSLQDVLHTRRGSAEVAYGRQIAMYIVYIGCGLSMSRVAAAFKRDRSTVCHACHRIEDDRDDCDMDEWLDALQLALSKAACLSAKYHSVIQEK